MGRRFVWCILVLSLAACRSDDFSQKNDDPKPTTDTMPPNPLGVGMLEKILKTQETPGFFDERTQSKDFDEGEPHYLVMEMSGPVTEMDSFDLLGGSMGVELRAIEAKFVELSKNPHLRGILWRVEGLTLDWPQAEELRGAMARFRLSGKQLHCHASSLSSVTYYLLSACETLEVPPNAGVDVTGVAATSVHLKGALDRLGVTADFVHIGAYKGAAEPLTRKSPSKESIKSMDDILDGVFAEFIAGVAKSRGMSATEVRVLVDRGLFGPTGAVGAKLIDGVSSFDAFVAIRAGDAGWSVTKLRETEGATQVMEFLGMMPAPRPMSPYVAVVHAVGNVVDGDGDGIIGARSRIAGRTASAAIRAVLGDENAKALVLRVNSPGGSAAASEVVWEAVAEFAKTRPVVVSMGSVAASGGYYIAAPATKIFALDTTLTGSIGVIGGRISIGDALARVGVRGYVRTRGAHAGMWSAFSKWTPRQRHAIRQLMNETYELFVARVGEGRNKVREEIVQVAQGRVWTGAQARKNGLVDARGGLYEAIVEARKLARLDEDAPVDVYPPRPTLRDFLVQFGAVSAHSPIDAALSLGAQVCASGRATECRAVRALVRQVMSLSTARVMTAAFVPLVQ